MQVEPAADEDVIDDEDMELQAMADEILEARVPKRKAEIAEPEEAKQAKKEHEFEEPAGPERQANKEMYCTCMLCILVAAHVTSLVCLDLSNYAQDRAPLIPAAGMVAWPVAEMPAEKEGGNFNDLLAKQAAFRAKKKEDCCCGTVHACFFF